MSETPYLKKFLSEIGYSVHNLNTIAVSLSNLPSNPHLNSELNIKWQPKDVKTSSIAARRFAVRSSLVFTVELLFDYISNISKDALWSQLHSNLDFTVNPNNLSKASRFSEFCKSIPGIEKEWYLLVELMCHWRNRIVHGSSSNATLSSKERIYLESRKDKIYEEFHHFDISLAISDHDANKLTLKEVTTLITFLIKCCRKIDEFYLKSASESDINNFQKLLQNDVDFIKIERQQVSKTRTRKIRKYINLIFSYLSNEKIEKIVSLYIRVE